MKIDTNTILTAISIAILSWVGTTLMSVDKAVVLMKYQIEEIKEQTYHENCAFCNHSKHEHIKNWLNE